MSRNLYKVWMTLLLISGGIAAWFSVTAGSKIWKYARLNATVPATVTKWEILDLPSSRFAVAGGYRYDIGSVAYEGETIFEYPQFLNRFAAENYLKQLRVSNWNAWYRKSSPSVSSLEREFPQKDCLQAILTIGVFGYFYFARSMLSRLF